MLTVGSLLVDLIQGLQPKELKVDIFLSEQTTDIVIENGELRFTRLNSEEIRQRIAIRLNTFLGEWALNTGFGVPYTQTIFGGNFRNKDELDALFLLEINRVPNITSVDDFQSELDRLNRTYSISRLLVTTTEGTQEVITTRNPDNITYPSPPTSLTFICEL